MDHPVILFDGVCNLCNGSVNFLIRRDPQGTLRFAPLQSSSGRDLLQQYNMEGIADDSFVLIEGGKLYSKSDAALRVFRKMPWYWQWMRLFYLIPRSLRDRVYAFIAKNRYRWFGRKTECMMPTPDMKSRFLE